MRSNKTDCCWKIAVHCTALHMEEKHIRTTATLQPATARCSHFRAPMFCCGDLALQLLILTKQTVAQTSTNMADTGIYAPACPMEQCQLAAANRHSGKSEECQDRHKAEGNQTSCRWSKPSSAEMCVSILPASRLLQNTTAAAIKENLKGEQMLGKDIPLSHTGIHVAPDSSDTSASIEHNQWWLLK